MTWFAHECWYCGLKSKDVLFLVSSVEHHRRRGESPYQCEDRDACEARRAAAAGLVDHRSGTA